MSRRRGGETGRALGLSVPAIIGLALLGVPRVIAHDLGPVGGVLNALLVFIPAAVWLVVVLWRRASNPLMTLLAIGLAYGVLLGLTHQVLWWWAFDAPPRLGGNLEGALSLAVEELVLRLIAFASSLVTGLAVGAVTGAVAWLIARAVPAFRPPDQVAPPSGSTTTSTPLDMLRTVCVMPPLVPRRRCWPALMRSTSPTPVTSKTPGQH